MPRQYTPRVSLICAACGKPFAVMAYRAGTAKFCRDACYKSVLRTHGESAGGPQSPEYTAWVGIKDRCLNATNAAYPNYGGRGITICDAWRDDFSRFRADVGRRPSPAHSLDRVDNSLGYEPGNVRWATRIEQARNQRSNRLIEFLGETRCMSAWAETVGLSKTTLHSRLQSGWTIERALSEPLHQRKSHVNQPRS